MGRGTPLPSPHPTQLGASIKPLGNVWPYELVLFHIKNLVDADDDMMYVWGDAGSKSIDVVKMLLGSGVDVNHKNMLGMNALLLVAGYGNDHLVRLIIQSGADPYSTNDFGHTALHLAIVGKRSQVGLHSDGARCLKVGVRVGISQKTGGQMSKCLKFCPGIVI